MKRAAMSDTSENWRIKKPRNLIWKTIMSSKLYLWPGGYRTLSQLMCNLVNMTRLICMKISGLRVCCNKREQTELVKKDAAAGRGVGNWQNPAKELNKSSCLKGVHKIQKGLHPVRGPTFHTEDRSGFEHWLCHWLCGPETLSPFL